MSKKALQIIAMMAVFLTILLTLVPLYAGEGKLGFTSYYFSDSGGNSVRTNAFNLAKKILGRTVILLDMELDNVTIPAITAITGATRPKRESSKPFEKKRTQIIAGVEQGLSRSTTMAINLYRSQEEDYVSNSVIATYRGEFSQKNSILSIRGQYISDKVGKILDDGSLANQDKNAVWAVGSFSQILSPKTLLDISYDALYLQGFLSDPYRQVQVFDENNAYVIVDEKHPDRRLRQAVSGKLSQFIPEVSASLMGSYRFYFDDWDVRSHTFEIQFNKYVLRDLISRFNYRFYTQSGARFFRDRYVGEPYLEDAFRTGDYKLEPFFSNNIGLSVTYLFRGLARTNPGFQFLENASAELRYFRYFNTLDFSANIFQLNIDVGI